MRKKKSSKVAGYEFRPSVIKTPKVAFDPSEFLNTKPAWRIGILETDGPFGWHRVDPDTIDRVRDRLIAFESMTWREILVQGKKYNHKIPLMDLCKEAQDRLREKGSEEVDEIYSLRVCGKERVFGILDRNIFRLLWWDTDHKICPSLKKHT